MFKGIDKIIGQSSFIVHAGRYIYAKVSKAPTIDSHFLVSKDKDEITLVTREENLKELNLIEKNKDFYSLIELKVSVPFYSVGFLATVSNTIAKEGMNILIVSTYSKDYILIREDRTEKAKKVLLSLGFKKES